MCPRIKLFSSLGIVITVVHMDTYKQVQYTNNIYNFLLGQSLSSCSVCSEVEDVVAELHHGSDKQSPERDANETQSDIS